MVGPFRGGRVTAVTGIAEDPHTFLMGVTGARAALAANIEEKVRSAKALGDTPVCVGFGVSNPDTVAAALRRVGRRAGGPGRGFSRRPGRWRHGHCQGLHLLSGRLPILCHVLGHTTLGIGHTSQATHLNARDSCLGYGS